ncbi:MAG: OB-fold nucleic acid binding domain-containing protein, partial [Pseudomonadota bacterium]|nr:OB-fold nucleic acid binding domain-containing protein [Pseudomonadota bacterium]
VFDFARRAGGLGLNRKLLENLISAGALDCLEPDRARLSAGVDMLLGEANIAQNERKTQQENLFGEAEMAESAVLPSADPWSAMDRLAHEFDAIGFYLSGHPLDDYQNAMKRARIVAFADLEKRVENELMIAGVVTRIDERRSPRGPLAFVSLSDVTGQAEVTVFSEALSEAREFLDVGVLMVATVKVEREDRQIRMIASRLRPLDQVVGNASEGLRIFVEKPEACAGLKKRLSEARQAAHKAGGTVSLVMMSQAREVELRLADNFVITPRVTGAIKALPGILHVEEL